MYLDLWSVVVTGSTVPKCSTGRCDADLCTGNTFTKCIFLSSHIAAEYILVTSLFCNRYKVNLDVGSFVSTGF